MGSREGTVGLGAGKCMLPGTSRARRCTRRTPFVISWLQQGTLVGIGYTANERLALWGRSPGGLVVMGGDLGGKPRDEGVKGGLGLFLGFEL